MILIEPGQATSQQHYYNNKMHLAERPYIYIVMQLAFIGLLHYMM